jgi:hypothetical protein
MKKLLPLCLAISLFSGCALWPAKVSYFEKKVKPVPALSPKAADHQRQAAQYVAIKTEQVEAAAIAEKSSPAVLVPAAEAKGAAAALTESLGPSEKPWLGDVTNLIQTLHKDQASLNEKVESYRQSIRSEIGKKIAGTGKFSIGYFTNLFLWIGGGVLLLFLIWAGVKAYGMFNPAVSLGTNLAGGIAGKALSAATSEIVGGGEKFLTSIENSPITADVKGWITGLFKTSQQMAQSPATSALVDKLTVSSPATQVTMSAVATPPAAISTTGPVSQTPSQTPSQTLQIVQPTVAVAVPRGTSLPPSIATEIMAWFAGLLVPSQAVAAAPTASPAPVQVSTPSPAAPAATAPSLAAPVHAVATPPTVVLTAKPDGRITASPLA